jgi:hypothetical protein
MLARRQSVEGEGDWADRATAVVERVESAPAAFKVVAALPETASRKAGAGASSTAAHKQRVALAMEHSKGNVSDAIKDTLLFDLDREEERLLDTIHSKTKLLAQLEAQSRSVTTFLESSQTMLAKLDLQVR